MQRSNACSLVEPNAFIYISNASIMRRDLSIKRKNGPRRDVDVESRYQSGFHLSRRLRSSHSALKRQCDKLDKHYTSADQFAEDRCIRYGCSPWPSGLQIMTRSSPTCGSPKGKLQFQRSQFALGALLLSQRKWMFCCAILTLEGMVCSSDE